MKLLAMISLVPLLIGCNVLVWPGTQYMGHIYPDENDPTNSIYIGDFNSLDTCHDIASDALDFYERQNGTEGKGSYDCDKK